MAGGQPLALTFQGYSYLMGAVATGEIERYFQLHHGNDLPLRLNRDWNHRPNSGSASRRKKQTDKSAGSR